MSYLLKTRVGRLQVYFDGLFFSKIAINQREKVLTNDDATVIMGNASDGIEARGGKFWKRKGAPLNASKEKHE